MAETTWISFDNAKEDVFEERCRQIKKWGNQTHDPFKWLAILGEEFGEVSKNLAEDGPERLLRAELIQLAAVTIAFIECMDVSVAKDGTHMGEWLQHKAAQAAARVATPIVLRTASQVWAEAVIGQPAPKPPEIPPLFESKR